MGIYCIFDRDKQCFEDCPGCVRYKPDECCSCGTTNELVTYDDEKYYCATCLADKLIRNISDKVIESFIDTNFDIFVKYVGGYYD